jgi:hypothetical protein
MMADEWSQLLEHSQLCEDERVAFALQMQFLGCDDAFDVVDDLLVEVAAAHNAQAASIFAQDAAIAEKEAAEADALRRTAVDDAALARASHEAEMKKEALARLDRELVLQIDQMPNCQWQRAGEQTYHPEVELASQIVRDVVAAEQELDYAKKGHLALTANRQAAEISDSGLSQEAAFASIDARKASKTSGKAIATPPSNSTSAGSPAMSAAAIPFVPADHGSSALSAMALPFEPAEQPVMESSMPHMSTSIADDTCSTVLSECMVCFEDHDPAECIHPMVLRRPRVGDLVLARYKPSSHNWKSAIVLRTSPEQAKQPWVAVTFEGFADEVIIPSDRLRFAPSAAHAASVWQDDGAMGYACGHSLCKGCLGPYLSSLVAEGAAEVACCQPHCNGMITIERCTDVLGSTPDTTKLRQMQNEAALAKKVFCVNTKCCAVFDAVYATLGVHGVKSWPKVQCPRCCTDMCADCHVPWHEGVACNSFQQLPGDFRTQADLDLLRLAAEQQFRKCPSCGELIERRVGDCNWVSCRCSCKFCYACGARYKKHKPTATNEHGTPGCKCGLFDDVKPHDDAGAVLLGSGSRSNTAPKVRKVSRPDGPYKPGKEKVKFLHHMDVLPVPCKFSRTHAGCPWGKKCWYKHEDDD